jgi:hypothetical protein
VPTSRENAPFRLTPMLLASVVAAVACTILLALAFNDDFNARQIPGQPPPHSRSTLVVVAAVTVIAWVALLIAIARDQIVRHIDGATARIMAQTSIYGEHREQEGVFLGMDLQARDQTTPPAGRTTPPPAQAQAPRGEGQVLPFPRSSSPEDSTS